MPARGESEEPGGRTTAIELSSIRSILDKRRAQDRYFAVYCGIGGRKISTPWNIAQRRRITRLRTISYGQLKLLPYLYRAPRRPRFEKIVASLAPRRTVSLHRRRAHRIYSGSQRLFRQPPERVSSRSRTFMAGFRSPLRPNAMKIALARRRAKAPGETPVRPARQDACATRPCEGRLSSYICDARSVTLPETKIGEALCYYN